MLYEIILENYFYVQNVSFNGLFSLNRFFVQLILAQKLSFLPHETCSIVYFSVTTFHIFFHPFIDIILSISTFH